jgi:hypothetical protein
VVADLGVEAVGVDVACARDHDVLANVVGLVELLDLVGSDGVDHVLDAAGRLAEVVVSEGSVVRGLGGDGEGVHRGGVLVDGGLERLHLHAVEGGLQDHLSQQLHCLSQELRLEGQRVLRQLSGNVDVQLTAEGFHQLVDLVLRVLGSAGERAVGHEVSH